MLIATRLNFLAIRAMGRRSPTLIDIVMAKYCTDIGTSALINNKRFRQLDVVTDDAYEIEMNKSVAKYTLPFHIGWWAGFFSQSEVLSYIYLPSLFQPFIILIFLSYSNWQYMIGMIKAPDPWKY